jgi:serpin B
MRNRLLRPAQVLAAFLLAMGRFQPSLGAPVTAEPAAAAVNALGIDLLKKTSKPDANALLSPYSIQSALAMAYAGADGVTREEMVKALHYPKDEAALHQSFAALRKTLEELMRRSAESSERQRQYSATNDPLVLTIANRLFGQSGYEFRQSFLSLLNDSYAAPFEPMEFKKHPALAARHINVWVENQTRQRIRNLVAEDALNELTRLVLVNAIYLKAPWAEPFEPSATKPGPFYVNGGQRFDVPTMNKRHELPFAQGDGFVAVSLPLAYPLQFRIFLPAKRDGLALLEKQLSPDMLAGKIKWERRDVTLSLPRFKLEPPVLSLRAALQALGMKTAFDVPPGSANFDRIAPRRLDDYLAISDVFHKTFLNLDEKGIEAAAATAILFETAGIHQPPKPVEVRVDHPFLFAIVTQSGTESSGTTCLFLGHVTDPR